MLNKAILESFDWNQLTLEDLKVINSKISWALKQKNKDLKQKKQELSGSVQSAKIIQRLHEQNYKVKINSIHPKNMGDLLKHQQKCVFGISLSGNKNFEGARLEACIRWISKHFKSCLVLVGDSVHRLTIEIVTDLKGEDARSEALDIGQNFVNRYHQIFKHYSETCSFEFVMASEIEKRLDFKHYNDILQSLYQENPSFEATVRSFAQVYLSQGDKVKEEEKLPQIENLSASYLLEESAIFACLSQEEWSVLVYPGTIKSLEEISDGRYSEVPEPLQKMTLVSLYLQKAGFHFVQDSPQGSIHTIENKVCV